MFVCIKIHVVSHIIQVNRMLKSKPDDRIRNESLSFGSKTFHLVLTNKFVM